MTAAEALARTFALLRAHAGGAIVAFVMMTGLGLALDASQLGQEAYNYGNFALSLLVLAVQLWLIRALLRGIGREPVAGRYISLFGMNIVFVLAIGGGLVLLVAPGLILFVRWAVAVPVMISSQAGIIDSLAESWRVTAGRFRPVGITLVAAYAPGIALFGIAVAIEVDSPGSLLAFAFAESGVSAALIGGWFAAVALYDLLPDAAHSGRISEIFA